MLVGFPLAAAILLFALFRRRRDWPEALLFSAVAWAALVVAGNELLSLWNGLAAGGLCVFWTLVCVALGGAGWRWARLVPARDRGERGKYTPLDWVMIGLLVALIAAVGVIALAAPPNTWDAMTYHMPRVTQWMQNRSVAYFPTHNSRQLEMGPGAEYIIVQLQILTGGDHLANLPQWFAMAASTVAAALIAQRLGASRRGQIVAALICATLPAGILEASGAKNDYVTTLWVMCAIVCLMDWAQSPGRRWPEAILFGLAIGLAMLTKSTTYLFCGPVLLVLVAAILVQHRWKAIRPLGIAAVIALLLNAPYFYRNLKTFHDPLGGRGTHFSMQNRVRSPGITLSNMIRNGVVHLATPSVPFNEEWLYRPVVALHQMLGMDPNDPNSTYDPLFASFDVRWGEMDEDSSGNGLHLLLILSCLVVGPMLPAFRGQRMAMWLAAALVGGYVVFCWLINWQPWHARYEIILFGMWAPVLAVFLEKAGRWVTLAVVLGLWIGAVPFVLLGEPRPMLGKHNVFSTPRIEQYFTKQPALLEPYRKAAVRISQTGEKHIGMLSGSNCWAYPLWVMLRQASGPQLRMDYLNGFDWPVESPNKVRITERDRGPVSVLVVLKDYSWDEESLALADSTGRQFWLQEDFGPLAVFGPVQQDLPPRIILGEGWAGVERPDWGWGSWSSQGGVIRLQVAAAGDYFLQGQMISGHVPNPVRVRLNGIEVELITINWPSLGNFGPLKLSLHAGVNQVQFISQAAPIQYPPDTRQLGLLIGNLNLRRATDGKVFPLVPSAAE